LFLFIIAEIHFHVRRFPIESIPNDVEAQEKWLLDRWVEKDNLCAEFMRTGSFPKPIDEPFKHLPLQYKL